MNFGALLMPSHPPEVPVGEGLRRDLDELERLDALGFEEAWIGEHFTTNWEPCPAPDLLIAQALQRTKQIRLGPITIPSNWLTGSLTSITWRKDGTNSVWGSAPCQATMISSGLIPAAERTGE